MSHQVNNFPTLCEMGGGGIVVGFFCFYFLGGGALRC